MTSKLASEVACSHHWVIDDGLHETSKGLCKRCGARKTFSNHFKPAMEETGTSAKVVARHRVRKKGKVGLLDQIESLFQMTDAAGTRL